MECDYSHRGQSSNWSKWSQYRVRSGWNGITHVLSIQINGNGFSMEWTAHGMWLLVDGITHPVRDRLDQSEVSIDWAAEKDTTHTLWSPRSCNPVSKESAAHGLSVRTRWKLEEFQTISVLNEKLMEWHYPQTEIPEWSKRGQYCARSWWNVITHVLSVKRGQFRG